MSTRHRALELDRPVGLTQRLRGIGQLHLWLLLSPSLVWLALCVLAPLSLLVVFSFWKVQNYALVHDFTLSNYADLFSGDQVYFPVLWKTIRLALLVTLTCLPLGYLIAYYVARRVPTRWKPFIYLLVLVPMWTSYAVRVYSWKTVLDTNGILNDILLYVGILKQPSSVFLYNTFAVYLALVSAMLPFMVMPIYSALEKIPRALVEASGDLNAGPARTFWLVTWPLSLPGVLAGATFTFVFTIGDFVASQFLGGTTGMLVGRIVYATFGLSFDWPSGAAMSFVLLIVVFAIIAVTGRFGALREM